MSENQLQLPLLPELASESNQAQHNDYVTVERKKAEYILQNFRTQGTPISGLGNVIPLVVGKPYPWLTAELATAREQQQVAVATFNSMLPVIDNLDHLVAFVGAAAGAINKHKYWEIEGKKMQSGGPDKNTNTWNRCLKTVRQHGLRLMEQGVKDLGSTDLAEYKLKYRNHITFASHRNTSRFRGAFWRTRAQRTIDQMGESSWQQIKAFFRTPSYAR